MKSPLAIGKLSTYFFEIYCDNPDCTVRETEITVKIQDTHDIEWMIGREWQCPLCHRLAKTHHVEDVAEHNRRDLESAIGTVNTALYIRDTGAWAVPAEVMVLDQLPEEWKYQGTEEKTEQG